MSDQLVAEAATYTTQQTQGISIDTLSRTRTGNHNIGAAADVRLTPRRHWDQPNLSYRLLYFPGD